MQASGVLVSLVSRARQSSPLPAGGQPAGSAARSSSSSNEACPASVSVIVPALNEEKCIGATLRYLKSMTPAPAEIIVVDGGSSDGTVRAARQEGAKVVRSKQRGRGAQMNAGADAAKGEPLASQGKGNCRHLQMGMPVAAQCAGRGCFCTG